MLTPENSGDYFFDDIDNLKLSAHGEMARGIANLIHTHNRGTPYIPILVVIDEFAGYSTMSCGGNKNSYAWGVFDRNDQASETAHLDENEVPNTILYDLFETQIWPSKGRSGEQLQLRPTPYGEIVDVAHSGNT